MVQIDTKNERKERERTKRSETGKYFYDLSKTSFSITFLGSLPPLFGVGDSKASFSLWYFATGIILSIIFFIIGFKILNK